MPRPTQREVILDAFQDLIVENGATNVTLVEAATRAGVSKGGLLYHFPSKSDLFAGLCERLAATIDTAIDQAPDDPAGLVRWYLNAATDVVVSQDTLWLSLFAVAHAIDDDDIAADLRELFARYSTPLAALPVVVAEHVRLVGDGLYFNALIGGPNPDPAALVQITDSLVRNAQATPKRCD